MRPLQDSHPSARRSHLLLLHTVRHRLRSCRRHLHHIRPRLQITLQLLQISTCHLPVHRTLLHLPATLQRPPITVRLLLISLGIRLHRVLVYLQLVQFTAPAVPISVRQVLNTKELSLLQSTLQLHLPILLPVLNFHQRKSSCSTMVIS